MIGVECMYMYTFYHYTCMLMCYMWREVAALDQYTVSSYTHQLLRDL